MFAFEPIKSTAEITKTNMVVNKCDGIVEIVEMALSDSDKNLYFTDAGSNSSAVDIEKTDTSTEHLVIDTNDLVAITATSLDSFVQERGIKKVDF